TCRMTPPSIECYAHVGRAFAERREHEGLVSESVERLAHRLRVPRHGPCARDGHHLRRDAEAPCNIAQNSAVAAKAWLLGVERGRHDCESCTSRPRRTRG